MERSTGPQAKDGPSADYEDLDPIPRLTLRCATCGTPLGNDSEDEPDGDAGLPICGECNRARNFDLDRFGVEDQ